MSSRKKLMKPPKKAWLIGLYTNETEFRIKRLGYKLVRYFPTTEIDIDQEEAPQMIVFSSYEPVSPREMHQLRYCYPEAILISLSLYPPSQDPACYELLNPSSNFSLIRLLKNIEMIEESL